MTTSGSATRASSGALDESRAMAASAAAAAIFGRVLDCLGASGENSLPLRDVFGADTQPNLHGPYRQGLVPMNDDVYFLLAASSEFRFLKTFLRCFIMYV
jgi:hypothetical protein